MPNKTLVFDLETKRLAHEVGGWAHKDRLGLSAAVLFDVESKKFMHFVEDQVIMLIDEILAADKIVGFNVIGFDYEVLKPYGLRIDAPLIDRTIDLLDHIYNELGFRLSLANLAEATLGEGKSADGLLAVEWYREGKIEQVLEYCEQDVRVTYRLWEYGRKKGIVKYQDRSNLLREVSVSW